MSGLYCLQCRFTFQTDDAVKEEIQTRGGPAIRNRCPECMSSELEKASHDEEEDALAYIAERALCRRRQERRQALIDIATPGFRRRA